MKPGVLLLVYLIVSAVLALATAPFAVRALRRLKAGQTVLGYVTAAASEYLPSARAVPS